MNKIMKVAVSACAVAIAAGCSTTPVAFVDKSIPMEQGRYAVVADEVEGTDTYVSVLGYGLGLPGSPQRRALKDALAQSQGADGLVSMAVDQQILNLYWVQFITTRVTGTPVKTK